MSASSLTTSFNTDIGNYETQENTVNSDFNQLHADNAKMATDTGHQQLIDLFNVFYDMVQLAGATIGLVADQGKVYNDLNNFNTAITQQNTLNKQYALAYQNDMKTDPTSPQTQADWNNLMQGSQTMAQLLGAYTSALTGVSPQDALTSLYNAYMNPTAPLPVPPQNNPLTSTANNPFGVPLLSQTQYNGLMSNLNQIWSGFSNGAIQVGPDGQYTFNSADAPQGWIPDELPTGGGLPGFATYAQNEASIMIATSYKDYFNQVDGAVGNPGTSTPGMISPQESNVDMGLQNNSNVLNTGLSKVVQLETQQVMHIYSMTVDLTNNAQRTSATISKQSVTNQKVS